MKKLLLTLLALLLAYLLFWPVPIDPQAWQAPENPGYTGSFQQNDLLTNVEILPIDGTHGPEALAAGPDGLIYASSHEGWIIRHNPENKQSKRWVNTGGRPLGIVFDHQGNLLVADAYRGLLSIAPDGSIQTLTDRANGEPIKYADDLDITPDGKVYFSDASSKFGAEESGGTYQGSLLDLLEHGYHGRLLVYDPADGSTRVVMDGLSFANGVAADPAGRFVLVNETGENRIHKVWLEGDKAGSSEIIIDSLPGFPDNIVRGRPAHGNARYWVGLVSPRLPVLDKLADKPFIRKILQRLPAALKPGAKHYSHVFAIDENGEVLVSLQDPAGGYHTNTGALEYGSWLYISSLHEDTLARLPLNLVPGLNPGSEADTPSLREAFYDLRRRRGNPFIHPTQLISTRIKQPGFFRHYVPQNDEMGDCSRSKQSIKDLQLVDCRVAQKGSSQ